MNRAHNSSRLPQFAVPRDSGDEPAYINSEDGALILFPA